MRRTALPAAGRIARQRTRREALGPLGRVRESTKPGREAARFSRGEVPSEGHRRHGSTQDAHLLRGYAGARDRMHIHGSGGRSRRGKGWVGFVVALAALIVSVFAVLRGGWQALAPFAVGALILFVILGFMRATWRKVS